MGTTVHHLRLGLRLTASVVTAVGAGLATAALGVPAGLTGGDTAGGWVGDASRATAPARTVRGSLMGAAFASRHVQIREMATVKMDGLSYRELGVDLRSEDSLNPEMEAHVTIAVKKGEQPDGKTYVVHPHRPVADVGMDRWFADLKSSELLPGLDKGTRIPQVQGINITRHEDGEKITLRQADEEAAPTLLLRFGNRRGGVLPGAIYLCWNDMRKSYVAGSFNATIKRD